MSFARKVKRANFIKEKKARIREAKRWYVRTIQYRGHLIEQKPNHTICIYKDGQLVAETTKCHRPMTDYQLHTFFDLYLKLAKKSKDGKNLDKKTAQEIADSFFEQLKNEVDANA